MIRITGMRGFTLVELIVVIVISGIVATFVARNIARPVQGFVDTTRRAALVDAGDTATRRLIRESRLALPNSVRINNGIALEFLRTRSGGRYRARTDPAPGAGFTPDVLDFSAPSATPDTSFDVLGSLRSFGQICAATSPTCGGATASTAACMADTRMDCLVIYNTGQPGDCSLLASGRTNAYCGDNVAGIDIADVAGAKIHFVNDAGNFPFPSPNQRFHIVDTPVSYICDTGARTLSRYAGYPIGANQPTLATLPAATARVLSDKVIDCAFEYDPGNASRAALLTVRLKLADSDAPGETISLFQQAHVPNVP